MLRHYDKGPCRNKLGHSRASLFFHRTQVIKKKYSCSACIIYWTYLPPIMLGVLLIDSEVKVFFRSFRHCYVLVIISAVQYAMHSAFNRREVSSEVHALQYCRMIPFSKDANQIFIIYVPLSWSLVRYSAPRGLFSWFSSFPL